MSNSTVTILTYHRIADAGSRDLAPTLIDAYPADFEAQMRYLAGHYNVVSSWDIVRALREGYTLPRRALAITFDDGYICFRDTAFPILRRLGLPVTLFVATGYTSNPTRLFWWDAIYRALTRTAQAEIDIESIGRLPLRTNSQREYAFNLIVPIIETRREADAARLVDSILSHCNVEPNRDAHLLGWDDVASLAAEGVAIGPHTREHPILAQVSPERARAEIEGSWADLGARIPRPLPIFCYPNGQPYAVNRAAREAVRAAGFAGAVTMVAGLNVLGQTNPFLLHRIGAVAGESLDHFRLKISPAGRLYRRVKAIARRKPLHMFEA
ncbi:MAG: polysaccharide deacetylase family protein [Chloroflexota bacterium]